MVQTSQKLSQKFIISIKLGDEPAYRPAMRAGVHPTVLSRLMNGAEKVKPNDERIVAVGREIGLRADECFESCEAAAK
jgi:hypothetical protein